MKLGIASVAVVAAGVATANVARADDGGAVAPVAVASDMHGYYGGERVAAIVIGGMGAAAAGTGAYLVTRSDDFSRGLGGAWLGLGGLEALGALFYAVQVSGEIDHYGASLARDPASYRAEEIDHLRGTGSRFVYYRAIELGLTLGGGAMVGAGLATHGDAWTGTGVGLASLALPLFVIDSFNDARAKRYLDRVTHLSPSVGPDGSGGWRVGLGGRF